MVESSEEESAATEDLLRRLEQNGAFESPEQNKSPLEKASDILYSRRTTARGGRVSYQQIGRHLTELQRVQAEIDYAAKVRGSPLLQAVERMKAKAAAWIGKGYEIPSIDELLERQADVVSALQAGVRDAKRDSHDILTGVVTYRDNTSLESFIQATEEAQQGETEVAALATLYSEASETLTKTKKRDPAYSKLVKAQSNLRRRVQKKVSEIAKANQRIVFRDTELDALAQHEDLVNNAVLLLDQVEQYASDVLEHGQHTRQLYAFFKGGQEIMGASQAMFESLSKSAMLEAQEIAAAMQRMREVASKAQHRILLPDAFRSQIGSYSGDILQVTKGINMALEREAQQILNTYGSQR